MPCATNSDVLREGHLWGRAAIGVPARTHRFSASVCDNSPRRRASLETGWLRAYIVEIQTSHLSTCPTEAFWACCASECHRGGPCERTVAQEICRCSRSRSRIETSWGLKDIEEGPIGRSVSILIPSLARSTFQTLYNVDDTIGHAGDSRAWRAGLRQFLQPSTPKKQGVYMPCRSAHHDRHTRGEQNCTEMIVWLTVTTTTSHGGPLQTSYRYTHKCKRTQWSYPCYQSHRQHI